MRSITASGSVAGPALKLNARFTPRVATPETPDTVVELTIGELPDSAIYRCLILMVTRRTSE